MTKPSSLPPTVGERIAFARSQMGLRQEDLGKLLGMETRRGISTISRWERSDGAPQAATLPKLAAALNTTTDWLLNGTGDPPSKRVNTDVPRGTPEEGEKHGQELMAVVSQIGAKVDQLRAEGAGPERIEDMIDVLARTILHMFRRHSDPARMAREIAEYMLSEEEPPRGTELRHPLSGHGRARLPDEPRQSRRYSA